MWKKALLPILLILAVIVMLAAAAYWYTQKESEDWPFKSEHHH
jgi:type II secretory pathway component PulK